MKRVLLLLIVFISTNLISAQDNSEDQTPKPNYRLAAKYSPTQLGKMVHSTSVQPRWLNTGNKFWYQYKTTNGSKIQEVSDERHQSRDLFA